jgi:putative chitinase
MTPSAEQLRAFLPTMPRPDLWAAALAVACYRNGITTATRAAAFLGQVAHESNEFHRLVEGLSYSAERMRQTWPSRFPTVESAAPYVGQPERLANHVYSNRLGNGDEASGDGWRYRGRGLLQLTGRENYRAHGVALGLPLVDQPELLEQPDAAALSAAQFWAAHGCNPLADAASESTFDEITRIINGGTTGRDARRGYWRRARIALGLDP